jgi:hypothetical protein
MKIQVWLDCDGVLADFDTGFDRLTGTDARTFEDVYGTSVFWSRIQRSDSFFARLPVLEQGRQLYNLVKHLRPIILTGTPVGDWSVPQKLRWRDKHFPGVPMVTCRSKNKRDYCQPGDVLIDDLLKYRDLWTEAGGHFIHYRQNADETVETLLNYLETKC